MRTKEEILKVFKDNQITGYQLGKDIEGVTYVAANKFLNGETKNPYSSTLKLYNSYIDNGFNPVSSTDIKPVKFNTGLEDVSDAELIAELLNREETIADNPIYKLFIENEVRKKLYKIETDNPQIKQEIINLITNKL